MKRANGFTIVELLIVIVVVGVLAAISIVAYNNVAAKARDSQRAQDIKTISKALEMYYLDHGAYPPGSGSTLVNTSWSTSADNSWQSLEDYLSPYISNLPVDPINTGSGIFDGSAYGYGYFSNSSSLMYCGASGPRQFYYLGYSLEAGGQAVETVGTCSGSSPLQYSGSYHRVVR